MDRKYEKVKIIIIGPMGIGKSTVSKLLSEKLNLPLYDMDELRDEMYKEMKEFNKDTERNIALNKPKKELFEYWKPFEVKQLELLLQNKEGVFDVGGGHVVQTDLDLHERVVNLLTNEPYVINLYYSESIGESVKALSSRDELPEESKEFYAELNKEFIEKDIYKDLGKYNISTIGKSYKNICDEIINNVFYVD